MVRTVVCLGWLVCLAWAPGAGRPWTARALAVPGAQPTVTQPTEPADPRAVPADSVEAVAFVRAPDLKLAYPGAAPSVSVTYARPMAPVMDLWRPRLEAVHLNRFQTTVAGADRGAYLGLATGYVGSFLLGLWDEKTAMHMMAAGAAVGALWGGTIGNDRLDVQVRVRDD